MKRTERLIRTPETAAVQAPARTQRLSWLLAFLVFSFYLFLLYFFPSSLPLFLLSFFLFFFFVISLLKLRWIGGKKRIWETGKDVDSDLAEVVTISSAWGVQITGPLFPLYLNIWCFSLTKSHLTLCDPTLCSTPCSSVLSTISQSLFKFMSTESAMMSNYLILLRSPHILTWIIIKTKCSYKRKLICSLWKESTPWIDRQT